MRARLVSSCPSLDKISTELVGNVFDVLLVRCWCWLVRCCVAFRVRVSLSSGSFVNEIHVCECCQRVACVDVRMTPILVWRFERSSSSMLQSTSPSKIPVKTHESFAGATDSIVTKHVRNQKEITT